jgi:hypothetical protein
MALDDELPQILRKNLGVKVDWNVEDNELEVTRLRTAASAYSGRHRVRLVTRTTEEEGTKMLRVWRTE